MKKISFQLSMLCIALFCLPAIHGADRKRDMQISSKSPEARALFQQGLTKIEALHEQAGLVDWRKAVQTDPKFALAHILITFFSQDPAEQVAEREKALATRQFASPEEKYIIDWLANASQSLWLPAIQSMNEALQRYPEDKHLAWLAGWWLILNQKQPAKAIPLFERAIRIDPNFADPWNEVAYCYAKTGDFDRAFDRMKRYTELLPNEANPQDSFAEISRLAGRYEEALKHYRLSLKIDPTFHESQLGLGDTYALMGDEVKARAEYATAIQEGTKIQASLWALQSAATYVREGNLSVADEAFQAVATQAHADDFGNIEAEAYRSMALYQKDGSKALQLLDKAEATLHDKHKVPQGVLDEEMSTILRTRVERAVQNGNMELASTSLKLLEDLAQANSDSVVQSHYSGAAGAILLAQGKYEDAIIQLEEDADNPFSMQRLFQTYQKTGDKQAVERIAQKLAKYNEPLIEQAVVVLPFRKSRATSSQLGPQQHREWALK
jgi:tetratricopeptide (TPR) repeat protein